MDTFKVGNNCDYNGIESTRARVKKVKKVPSMKPIGPVPEK